MKDHNKIPLEGIRVLVTREQSQAHELCEALAQKGARPVVCPTICFAPPDDWKPVDISIKNLHLYDAILFTSANGVRFFLERMEKIGYKKDQLASKKIYTIGPATAKVLSLSGIKTEEIPDKFIAEGLLARIIKEQDVRGRRFLLPRAKKGRDVIPEELRRLGANVDIVIVYQTLRPDKNRIKLSHYLKESNIDCITFTSPSTVKNFVQMLGKEKIPDLMSGKLVACIGEITAREALKNAINVDIIPEKQTIESLVNAIVNFYQNLKRDMGECNIC